MYRQPRRPDPNTIHISGGIFKLTGYGKTRRQRLQVNNLFFRNIIDLYGRLRFLFNRNLIHFSRTVFGNDGNPYFVERSKKSICIASAPAVYIRFRIVRRRGHSDIRNSERQRYRIVGRTGHKSFIQLGLIKFKTVSVVLHFKVFKRIIAVSPRLCFIQLQIVRIIPTACYGRLKRYCQKYAIRKIDVLRAVKHFFRSATDFDFHCSGFRKFGYRRYGYRNCRFGNSYTKTF